MFFQNASVLRKWQIAMSKAMFPIPRMATRFYRHVRRSRTKEKGELARPIVGADVQRIIRKKCLLGVWFASRRCFLGPGHTSGSCIMWWKMQGSCS